MFLKQFWFKYWKQKRLFHYSMFTWTNYRRKSECDWGIQIVHNRSKPYDATSAWRERMTGSSKFYFKTKKMIWTKKLMQKCQNKMMLIRIYESWTNNTRKRKTIKNKSWKTILIKKRFLCTKFMNDWISHWMIYQNQLTCSTPIQTKNLKRLKMK